MYRNDVAALAKRNARRGAQMYTLEHSMAAKSQLLVLAATQAADLADTFAKAGLHRTAVYVRDHVSGEGKDITYADLLRLSSTLHVMAENALESAL